MISQQKIALLEDFAPVKDLHGQSVEIITHTLELDQTSICLHIAAVNQQVQLSEIVPLAQSICTKLTTMAIEQQPENSTQPTCHKGCSACCSYLIPLAVPEVIYYQNKVAGMSESNRRIILRSCLESSRVILHNSRKQTDEDFDIDQLSLWYGKMRLGCPFLSDNRCSIYKHRPLACREHLVTSPPELCQNKTSALPETIHLPVSILEVLGQLTTDLRQSKTIDAIILPLALINFDPFTEHVRQGWNAIEMVKRFIEILQDKILKQSISTQVSV